MDDFVPLSGEQDPDQFDIRAPVLLLEYGDYECPYCGKAYWMLKKIEKEVGDVIQLNFRNFPLSQIHAHAVHAAMAAEAAKLQGRFWEMHDLLFENQSSLEDEDLMQYANTLDLDMTRFEEDMFSEEVDRYVHEDFINGVKNGVNGTPTFFINGRRHDHWFGRDALLSAIDSAAGIVRIP